MRLASWLPYRSDARDDIEDAASRRLHVLASLRAGEHSEDQT